MWFWRGLGLWRSVSLFKLELECNPMIFLIAGGNLGVFGLGIGGGCGVGFGLGWGVGFGCGSKYIDQNFVFEETKGRRVKKELPQV